MQLRKPVYLLLLFLCYAQLLKAQHKNVLISGIVLSDDYKPLYRASVYVAGFANGTYTDTTGHFVLSVATGAQSLSFSYVGFKPYTLEMNMQRDTVIEVILQSDLDLDEVNIVENRITPALSQSNTGVYTVKAENITSLSTLLGEHDLVKSIQLLPGVQSGNEGVSGIFVRGGSADQNLVLLDGAPVYNPSHLYGFISVFNSDALSSVDLHKNDYPAQFGSRLGTVMDVKTAAGEDSIIKGSFSIGFVTSHFHLEGPIKKANTTFSLSVRGCYLGAISEPLSKLQFKKSGYSGDMSYYFYDVDARIDHYFTERTGISVSFFMNDDRYRLTTGSAYSDAGMKEVSQTTKKLGWKNFAASVNLNHKMSRVAMFNLTGSFSRYILNTGTLYEYHETIYPNYNYDQENAINHKLFVNEVVVKPELLFTFSTRHVLHIGAEYNLRWFQTGNFTQWYYKTGYDSTSEQITPHLFFTHTASAYIQYDMNPVRWFSIQSGIRARAYIADNKWWFYPQYRFSVAFTPVSAFGIRAQLASADQPLHMLTISTSDIGVDYWVPATKLLRPETGWQASGGFMGKIAHVVSWSIDCFYRTMQNLTELKQGGNFDQAGDNWQQEVIGNGTGRAYGLELFAAKGGKKLNVQAAYTLAWSQRKFSGINDGNYYPYKYDRRHNIALAATYKINDRWDITADWVYGSGNMYTLPVQFYSSQETLDYNNYLFQQNGTYNPDGESITVYNAKNSYRLPAYHHLDIGCNYRKQHNKLEHVVNISIYNVYSRQNVFSVYTDYRFDNTGARKLYLKQLSLFPILPSVSYTLNFRV